MISGDFSGAAFDILYTAFDLSCAAFDLLYAAFDLLLYAAAAAAAGYLAPKECKTHYLFLRNGYLVPNECKTVMSIYGYLVPT